MPFATHIGLSVILHTSKKDRIFHDLWERETMMSTGMQNGLALPHAKTLCINRLAIAVGISPTGVDFSSLDQRSKPTRKFVPPFSMTVLISSMLLGKYFLVV